MAPDESNGWAEYKRLFEQELQDNRHFRESMNRTLESINTQLAELKVEHKFGKWVMGVGVPAVVATIVTAVAKALWR